MKTKFLHETSLIVGVDEVGRGPLAGPVMAAAVILNPHQSLNGLTDSKLLSPKKRESLAIKIQQEAWVWAIGRAEVEEIDNLNILQASLLAMERALIELRSKMKADIQNNIAVTMDIPPLKILIDGIHCPRIPFAVSSCEAIIGGDRLIQAISAASILAKVIRDAEMMQWDKIYPQYGFAQHKGYGTKQHLLALQQHGVTPLHRRTFAPVKDMVCF